MKWSVRLTVLPSRRLAPHDFGRQKTVLTCPETSFGREKFKFGYILENRKVGKFFKIRMIPTDSFSLTIWSENDSFNRHINLYVYENIRAAMKTGTFVLH